MVCKCCKNCDCCKYIVLRDFWLEHIKLMKGQVITEPVSPRWIELGLISRYRPNIEIAKSEAQRIAEDLHVDKPYEKPNEVDESEVFVNARTSNPSEETEENPKKKRRGRPKKNVIVELPEKSEMLLQRMIELEADSL